MPLTHQPTKLSLYHFQACPFCARTRTAITQLDADVELLDIVSQRQYRSELIQGGGKSQVPCLKIEQNGNTHWLYESSDIIAYLSKTTGKNQNVA